LSGAKKGFLRNIGLDHKSIEEDTDDEEGDNSLKKVAKKKLPKRKPTAAERLQKGWEEWEDPSRRRLRYDKN